MRLISAKFVGTVSVFFLLSLAISWQQQSVALVSGEDVTTTTSSLAPDASEATTDKTSENVTKSPTSDAEEEDNAGSAKPSAKPEEDPDDPEEADDGSDPWGDGDDGESSKINIVDQMRELREKDAYITVSRNVSHLNETFDRLRHAWGIIDQYYLPEKETWEKLLGLVTALNVQVSPECFSSYFSGVSGFRNYAPWAYRCMLRSSFSSTKPFWLTSFNHLDLDVRGRFPESGSLAGRLASFGEYDECLELESPKSSSTGLIVKGQYCMMEVKAPYPMDTDDDLEAIVDEKHPVYQFIQKYMRAYNIGGMGRPQKVVEALRINNGTIFRAGLCIPALCKPHEVEAVIMNCKLPYLDL